MFSVQDASTGVELTFPGLECTKRGALRVCDHCSGSLLNH